MTLDASDDSPVTPDNRRLQGLGARLTAAMDAAKHNHRQCAKELGKRLGKDVDPSNVSRWAAGRATPRGRRLPVVEAYCAEHLSAPPSSNVSKPPGATDPPEGRSDYRDAPAVTEDFDDLVPSTTNEPLLGLRQGALVDAAIERVRVARGPYTAEDLKVISWLSTLLRLEPPLE